MHNNDIRRLNWSCLVYDFNHWFTFNKIGDVNGMFALNVDQLFLSGFRDNLLKTTKKGKLRILVEIFAKICVSSLKNSRPNKWFFIQWNNLCGSLPGSRRLVQLLEEVILMSIPNLQDFSFAKSCYIHLFAVQRIIPMCASLVLPKLGESSTPNLFSQEFGDCFVSRACVIVSE